MNSTRISIILFLLAAAIGPALLVSFQDASQAAAVQGIGRPSDSEAPGKGEAPMDPATFAPAGMKVAPWAGAGDGKTARAGESIPVQSPAAKVLAPVVLELFTSEGCSSCPPADKLLSELASEHARDPDVHLLAFHVDYWDHLGWKDSFASKAATDRQRAYAKVFASDQVYTPQLVVGGTTGFVGSDRVKAREAMNAARQIKPTVRLAATFEDAPRPGRSFRVRCIAEPVTDSAKLPAGMTFVVAVVEDGLTTRVEAGENKARTLAHDRVVRAFGQVNAVEGRGEIELTVPAGVNADRCRIVAMAQDGTTMRVLSVAKATLLSPTDRKK